MEQNSIFAGRYLLQEKIGVGGFSEVWKAADQMAEDSIIAIKIFAPEKGMDQGGLRQFRREYSVVLDLNHTNLLTARYFDVSEGRPYLIMPFIGGGSLSNRLSMEGAMKEADIAQLLSQISEALVYLHDNDILHQDIKPDNILIGNGDRYLLTDFGISSRLRSTLRKSTTSMRSMTVAYAPPERFDATPKLLPSGDVFSLGVLAYEMATGDVPWMGSGGMSLRTGAAVPELPASFSAGFRSLVSKMMDLTPANRPTPDVVAQLASAYLATGNWPPVGVSDAPQSTSEDHLRGSGRATQRMEDINPPVQPPASGGYPYGQTYPPQPPPPQHEDPYRQTHRMESGPATDSHHAYGRQQSPPRTEEPKTPPENYKFKPEIDTLKHRKSNKSTYVILLVLLLLVGGTVGGAWVYTNGDLLALFGPSQAVLDEVQSLKRQAEEATNNNNFEAAIGFLSRAQELHSRDESLAGLLEDAREAQFNALKTQADQKFDETDFTDAIRIYQLALEVKPGDSYTQNRIRESRDKEVEKARILAQAEASEREYQRLRNLGDQYFNQRNFNEAISAYRGALQYKPGDSYATSRIQQSQSGLDNLDRENRAAALERDGDQLVAQRQFQRARDTYNQALSLVNTARVRQKRDDAERRIPFTFREDFSRTGSTWNDFSDANRTWRTEGGVFKGFGNNDDRSYPLVTTLARLTNASRFEVTLDVRHVRGDNRVIGLIFAGNSDDSQRFGISGSGGYYIGRYVNNAWDGGWTSDNPAVNKTGAWNTLKVVYDGRNFQYYVNNTLVHSRAAQVYGNQVGIVLSGSVREAWFDNLTVTAEY